MHTPYGRKKIGLEAGIWPRFAHYEIRDGYIRPRKNARLEHYELFAGPGRAKSASRPYEALAEIVRQGRYTVSTGAATPETEAAVLSWCQRYGLLGVLLQRVETVVMPVRVATGDEASASQTWLHRTPRGWQMNSFGLLNAKSLPAPRDIGVMLHGLGDSEVVWEPLTQSWASFFPSVPATERETYSYPHPSSDEFWTIYAEPLKVFLDAAAELSRALEDISRGRGNLGQSKTRSRKASPIDDFGLAIGQLTGYTSTVRLSFDPSTDDITQRWVAPTLFASLAMTALQDLASRERLRTCVQCGRLFASRAYQARYCSLRCRRTVNKRTYRKRVKEKTRTARRHK